MDKTAIKNFAVKARQNLIEDVKQQAFLLGIEEGKIAEATIESSDSIRVNDRYLDKKEMEQRKNLIAEIENKGYEQVIEEVAYTWFNRLVALRYMEVNGYLPTRVRVLSSENQTRVEPDIIREAIHLDLDIDKELVYQFQDNNNNKGLYKYLLIHQCNALHQIMPFIFEEIADYTEILLPDNLLAEGSVIRDMVTEIREDDWREGVEIIGWLYQFYISEKKDEVFASKKKVSKEEIPAATQLFTPKWIVQYMVENSLGKLWLESHPNDDLKEKWEYYLEEAEQEPEVKAKLEEIRNKDIRPEEIKVLDPACGSGHILVYAFDVLYQIYQSVGYASRDIPQLILEKNLYGLDIDDRAAQLAYFAVMMKAREKNRRIFRKPIELNITAIQESNSIGNFEKKMIEESGAENIAYLIDIFEDAKDYGSILEVKPIDNEEIEAELELLKDKLGLSYTKIEDKLLALIKQAQLMGQKYEVVCTNPPYLGNERINSKLKKYLNNNFNNSKRDLFAVFIERCIQYCLKNKYIAMITQHSWMFLKSFNKIREDMLKNMTITSMVHLGSRAFEQIGGEVVQTTAFILQRDLNEKFNGKYLKLINYNTAEKKHKQYFNKENMYISNSSNFKVITGTTIAYWISDRVRNIFKTGISLGELAEPKQGLITGSNDRFLRLWSEININKVKFDCQDREESLTCNSKWFPYHKGGTFRKWYGNNDYLVNWENDGLGIRNFKSDTGRLRSRPQNMDYYFKEGLTWTAISTGDLSIRYFGKGFIISNAGMGVFSDEISLFVLVAYLNSKVVKHLLTSISLTLNFNQGDIKEIPCLKNYNISLVQNLVQQNIQISKTDWDSFETSWDFQCHPLLTHKGDATTIEDAFNNWADFAEEQFYQLKENEEELNRIFIDIYGLEDELSPEVEEKDVTVSKADRKRDIKSFISYAVGCMLGRYSLDEAGLAYAGGDFDKSKYSTFQADEDGIIPITKDEYFDDDIVARFIEFLKVCFGEENLEKNLDYIANTLKKSNKDSRETLRDYFLTKSKFYKDHCQTYNKRPIYWLFQSDSRGKAFNTLIYLHRYHKGTVAKVRVDYLHELQKRMEAEKKRLQDLIEADISASETAKAKKKVKEIESDLIEIREYDETLNHVANQQIELDLDDGVKENYSKFGDVLAKI